jgi:hypothetical protein
MVKGGEGPSAAFETLTSLLVFKLLLGVLGVPLTQLLLVLLLLGLRFSWPRWFLFRLSPMMLLPPMRL